MADCKEYFFVVEEDSSPCRVDVFLSRHIPELSRSALGSPGQIITINGKISKKSDIVSPMDEVSLKYKSAAPPVVVGEDIPLKILYEDDDILVINKEQGMVVHPGAGNYRGTVVNALAHRYGADFVERMSALAGGIPSGTDECGELPRPGIVHRLDRDTSGVMVIALNPSSLARMSEEFQNREVRKVYYALAEGFFAEQDGFIEGFIARDPHDRKRFAVSQTHGKPAKTHYHVQTQMRGYAFVRIRIYTGRTHQIRVHMKSIGHPILGDEIYNRRPYRFGDCSLMLHAYSLELLHPATGEKMRFTAPVPARFSDFLRSEESRS